MRNRRRYCPVVETLEGRSVPAVVVTTGIDLDSDGQLDDIRIVGDANDNDIDIDDDGTTLLIDVDKNGDGDFTDPGELVDLAQSPADGTIVLDIRLGDGDDAALYSINGDQSAQRRALAIDLGLGNDNFALLSSGALTNSSEMTLDLLAGKGNDGIGLDLPDLAGSLLAVDAAMGGGSDFVNLFTGSIDALGGADVDFDLGGGNNECALGVSSLVSETTTGYLDLDVIGGNSATASDTVSLSMIGTCGGGSQLSTVSVNVKLLAGNDQFTGTVHTNSFNVAALGVYDLSVQGGAGNDVLVMNAPVGDTVNIDLGAFLDLEFKGGAGNDDITVDMFAFQTFEVDGQFQLRIDGNDGSDDLFAKLAFAGSSGNLDIAIFGNAGNDTVTYDLTTGISNPTFNPAGVALLDGGLGSDTLDDDSDPDESDHQFFEIFV